MRHIHFALLMLTCVTIAACGGKSGGGSPAGTYKLDKVQFKEVMMKSILQDMGVKEIPAPMTAKIDEMIGSTTLEFGIKADGTWTVSGNMAGDVLNESGTWTLSGDQITMKTTKKDGKDVEESKTGTYQDGAIMIKPDDEAPGEIRLVRQ